MESPVRGIWWLRVSEAWRVERTEGCVKLEKETKRSSACDIFIAESVYLVLISVRNWEPVERLKQRSGKIMSLLIFLYLFVSCCLFWLFVFRMGRTAQFWMQWRPWRWAKGQADQKAEGCGGRVVTWVRWWPVLFYGPGGRILLRRANSAKLIETGFGNLTNEFFCMDSVQSRTPRLWQSQSGILVPSSWRVLAEMEGSLSWSDEHRFCLFTFQLKLVLCHPECYCLNVLCHPDFYYLNVLCHPDFYCQNVLSSQRLLSECFMLSKCLLSECFMLSKRLLSECFMLSKCLLSECFTSSQCLLSECFGLGAVV